jgi:hypothetical protein
LSGHNRNLAIRTLWLASWRLRRLCKRLSPFEFCRGSQHTHSSYRHTHVSTQTHSGLHTAQYSSAACENPPHLFHTVLRLPLVPLSLCVLLVRYALCSAGSVRNCANTRRGEEGERTQLNVPVADRYAWRMGSSRGMRSNAGAPPSLLPRSCICSLLASR